MAPSISGLSGSIAEGADRYDKVPELHPDEDYRKDPLAAFGILEAQRHRKRGVTIELF